MKSRILILFLGITVLWSALLLRAAYLQFLPNDRLNTLQSRQFTTKVSLPSRRGAIVDRNGRDLAMSTAAYSLYADPKIIQQKKKTARRLAKKLGVSYGHVFEKIKSSNRRFVWIQRRLDKATADDIKSWKIRGLSFVEEWNRVYPNETLLSQSLGFLGVEGQGLEGIEREYDHVLAGNPKKVALKRDARGRPLIQDGTMFIENPEGSEVRLTIDSDLQYKLESELANAVTQFEAESAVGVVLDAKTSAILAIGSAPGFDANKAHRYKAEERRNRSVTDVFEPGSTMKTFVIASALRKGILQPNKKYYCEKGRFKVGDRIIRESSSRDQYEDLTVAEILAVSSNVGMTKIAFEMGAEEVRKGLLDFGFGQKLNVDLPGEARGLIAALPWRPHLLSNISFGHGMAATPLQIANAFAAIANGGVLNTPYIVDSVRDAETGELKHSQVKPLRRVLNSDQAAQMRAMLVGVTTGIGTGKNARVEGFMVGGKTGTAQKVNPNGRGYLPGGYISSFGGFIPANDPKFVIYVAVDAPKKGYYASTVAAPVFARIASYAVRKEGIAPLPLASQLLNRGVASIEVVNKKSFSVQELSELSQVGDLKTMPDLKGVTVREVLRTFSGRDVKLKFVGQGVVKESYPRDGEELGSQKEITVILE